MTDLTTRSSLVSSLIKPNLLILDDFGLKRFDVSMGQDFNEVIEERSRAHRFTGITAQLPVKEWPSVSDDLTEIANGVMNRIVPNAYSFDLKGPLMRPCATRTPAPHSHFPSPLFDRKLMMISRRLMTVL